MRVDPTASRLRGSDIPLPRWSQPLSVGGVRRAAVACGGGERGGGGGEQRRTTKAAAAACGGGVRLLSVASDGTLRGECAIFYNVALTHSNK